MNCAFQCSLGPQPGPAELPEPVPTQVLSIRDDNDPLEAISALSNDVVQIGGNDFSASYAHGYCSFKMQLVQQCMNNPKENWHNEILGNLYSIEDANRKTVVRYPDGAGRIDNTIKRLTNFGDGLLLTYKDNIVFFRFDEASWNTKTPDDGHANGLCHWSEWTRPEWGCQAHLDGQRRSSDVTCVFKC